MLPESADPSGDAASPAPRRSRRLWLYRLPVPVLLAVGGLALIILSGGGYAAVTALEEHDPFCISCHTAPEITYFNRAYLTLDHPALAVPDLASQHYRAGNKEAEAGFRCIDCHRGDSSFGHRLAAIALGARDAMIFFAGSENPAIGKQRTGSAWLANASCGTCHSDTLLRLDGINNHFHTTLPDAKIALSRAGVETEAPPSQGLTPVTVDQAPTLCSDCHPPHHSMVEGSGDSIGFIPVDLRDAACIACHVAASQGPQRAEDLFPDRSDRQQDQ